MANTIYGSTLDSLSQNAIAQQQVDDARTNAYRQYLLGVGGLGQRGREIESMDRYRQGEIGVRQQDVGGMNEFRRGQVGIGMTEAGTRAKDVESLGKYRQGEIDTRMEGIRAGERASERVNMPWYLNPTPSAQAEYLKAQAELLKSQGKAIEGGGMLTPDMRNMIGMDTFARTVAANQLPQFNSIFQQELGKLKAGERWYDDSPDIDEVQSVSEAIAGTGSGPAYKTEYNKQLNALALQRAKARATTELGIQPDMIGMEYRAGDGGMPQYTPTITPSPYAALMRRNITQQPPRSPMLPEPSGMTPPEPMDVSTNRTGPSPLFQFWTQPQRRRYAPTQ